MPSFDSIGRPDPEMCFGRDNLCELIVKHAADSAAVLLFGSRQSGKTTILLRIQKLLLENSLPRHTGVIPVYTNLVSLPVDARPADAFNLLAKRGWRACRQLHPKIQIPEEPGECPDLETLIGHLAFLNRAVGRPDTKFLFLLDESKRVLGRRFPRGFQDNLFALLYGDHKVGGFCSIVFSGSQELYQFCEDETSPLGSRAIFQFVQNLGIDSVEEIVKSCGRTSPESSGDVAKRIHELSGGQAGLSLRMAFEPDILSVTNEQTLLESLRQKYSSILRIWATALSPEARSIQDRLIEDGALKVQEIPQRLKADGFDQYRADRVCEEFEFSGIATRGTDEIRLANKIYGEFVKAHTSDRTPTDEERSVWSAIEQAELALRRVVRDRYASRWTIDADNQIKSVLGTDSWETILNNKSKAAKIYRYTNHTPDGDVLHFAYFAQLTQLVISNKAWDMFKHTFRDKREVEDITADIAPVRNDSAHFRSVPPREATRCKLRCEDLIQILRKHFPALVAF
jgi:hypothetical protein